MSGWLAFGFALLIWPGLIGGAALGWLFAWIQGRSQPLGLLLCATTQGRCAAPRRALRRPTHAGEAWPS